ncbi:uncharacterized protein B0H64DRAFT_370774 [Chaetomium fimeti]|uniref:Helicase C-terminal domain-containing protein n=1 Tax=Chaetomium fimeti TaxID=1854472 RepID=A0AAE0HKJ5_9PEZI|nr:hypothetical protein B0H64DRAFT_370774 [Chaetomium fimeti]
MAVKAHIPLFLDGDGLQLSTQLLDLLPAQFDVLLTFTYDEPGRKLDGIWRDEDFEAAEAFAANEELHNNEDDVDDNDNYEHDEADDDNSKEEVKGMSLDTLLTPRVPSIIVLLQSIRKEAPEEKTAVASRTRELRQHSLYRCTGHINMDDRVENLRLFDQAALGPSVLFLSATAGVTGLNIATASRLSSASLNSVLILIPSSSGVSTVYSRHTLSMCIA